MTAEQRAQKLDMIASLPAEELIGWWETVHLLKLRDAFDGERAALLKRAQQLGVRL